VCREAHRCGGAVAQAAGDASGRLSNCSTTSASTSRSPSRDCRRWFLLRSQCHALPDGGEIDSPPSCQDHGLHTSPDTPARRDPRWGEILTGWEHLWVGAYLPWVIWSGPSGWERPPGVVGLPVCPVVVTDTVLEWDDCEERPDGRAEVVPAVTQRRVTATVTTVVVRKSPGSAVTSEE
jgi:hypothetical protein